MTVAFKNMKKPSGFTLLQMTVLLLILGLMAATAAAQYRIYLKRLYIEKNAERQEKVRDAIRNFYSDFGRLPCVARDDLPPTNANFGREVNCMAVGPITGTRYAPTGAGPAPNNNGAVRTGSIPVRTLGLEDIYAVDASGFRFIYAVTANLANTIWTPTARAPLTQGSIDICAGNAVACNSANSVMNGASVPAATGNCAGLQPSPAIAPAPNVPRYAVYTIIAPGKSGIGAYNLQGAQITACGGPSKDAWNCANNRNIFRGGRYVCTRLDNGNYSYLYAPHGSFGTR